MSSGSSVSLRSAAVCEASAAALRLVEDDTAALHPRRVISLNRTAFARTAYCMLRQHTGTMCTAIHVMLRAWLRPESRLFYEVCVVVSRRASSVGLGYCA